MMNEPKKNFKIVTETKARVILPNTLTLIGVCIGLTSINFALNGNYKLSIVAILFAAIMDGLDVDIHAWGNARDVIIREADEWFSINDHHFCLICDYANLDPSFIIRKYKQLRDANAKKLFRGKNLNKFLTHYICSFHEDPATRNSFNG